MLQNLTKFKGAEYFRKALYIVRSGILENHRMGALESELWSRHALLELRSILKQSDIYLNLSQPITSNKYDKGKRHQKWGR